MTELCSPLEQSYNLKTYSVLNERLNQINKQGGRQLFTETQEVLHRTADWCETDFIPSFSLILMRWIEKRWTRNLSSLSIFKTLQKGFNGNFYKLTESGSKARWKLQTRQSLQFKEFSLKSQEHQHLSQKSTQSLPNPSKEYCIVTTKFFPEG